MYMHFYLLQGNFFGWILACGQKLFMHTVEPPSKGAAIFIGRVSSLRRSKNVGE